MSGGFGALCDDFYVSSRLYLKLPMGLERETVLHFLDRIRKDYPRLQKLRRRDGDGIVLEEEPDDQGSRRWIRLDPTSLRFGHYAPPDTDDVRRLGELILTHAPYHLSFSEIDYDHLEVVYGFDLNYRGNHDQLVADTLLGEPSAGGSMLGGAGVTVIDAQPYFGVALTPECDLQAYVEVKSRTTTFEVRSGQYENEPISVFLTTRKYWGIDNPPSLGEALQTLFDAADELASDRVVYHFVKPLAAAIASRP